MLTGRVCGDLSCRAHYARKALPITRLHPSRDRSRTTIYTKLHGSIRISLWSHPVLFADNAAFFYSLPWYGLTHRAMHPTLTSMGRGTLVGDKVLVTFCSVE